MSESTVDVFYIDEDGLAQSEHLKGKKVGVKSEIQDCTTFFCDNVTVVVPNIRLIKGKVITPPESSNVRK